MTRISENPSGDVELSYRDLVRAFRALELDPGKPCIAHASLSAFGRIRGGADTLLAALLTCAPALIMPAFTYQTMLIPEAGPEDNAMSYGSGKELNRHAEFYSPDMPVNPLIGRVAETLRCTPRAQRSAHPILSFTGIQAEEILSAQTEEDPLAPIRKLVELDGWFLLLGVDHSTNTSIHYAESLVGRQGFLRWALTPEGVVACPGYPGCSRGFDAIASDLGEVVRKIQVGGALVQAAPLSALMVVVRRRLAEDPYALLCDFPTCDRCQTYRKRLALSGK